MWIARTADRQLMVFVSRRFRLRHSLLNATLDGEATFCWVAQNGFFGWSRFGAVSRLYVELRKWGCPRSWNLLTTRCSLGVTAYLWARDPWVSDEDFSSRVIGVPSQIVAILWMGLSASLDGFLTLTLIRCLWRARSPTFDNTNDVIKRLIALTLETVLLTHICGAIMCVLFLSQPAAHRTKSTAFWIFLEIVTELYALSIVFTINARSASRRILVGPKPPTTPIPASPTVSAAPPEPQPTRDFRDQRQLDFAVEGYQDIPRFSYHFPTATAPGAGAPDPPSLTDHARRLDNDVSALHYQPSPLELSPIGPARDLEKGDQDQDDVKDYRDSESSTAKPSEESSRHAEVVRKRLAMFRRR